MTVQTEIAPNRVDAEAVVARGSVSTESPTFDFDQETLPEVEAVQFSGLHASRWD